MGIGYRKYPEGYTISEDGRLDLEKARDCANVQNLFDALRAGDMDVCSGPTLPFGDPPHRAQVFSEADLALQYQRYDYNRQNNDAEDWRSLFRIEQLLLLCPEHFRENPDFLRRVIDPNAVISPVERHGERLIATATGQDVSRILIRRRFHPDLYRSHGMHPFKLRRIYEFTARGRFLGVATDPTRFCI